MRNIGNNAMVGAGFAQALAAGSQQAKAGLIFQESFEGGAFRSGTDFINDGIRKVGDFCNVVDPGTPVDINYDVGELYNPLDRRIE